MKTRVELLMEAQTLLMDAITLLEVALENDDEAQDYLIDHLQILASNDHGFLSNDLNLDKLIERYENDDEEIEVGYAVEQILER